MRNKNTIVFLLLVFTAICIYNLVWTGIQFNDDSRINSLRESAVAARQVEPQERSPEDSAAIRDYEALLNDNDFQARYKKATENSFTLGLDLQGGMFVTLEVGIDNVIRQLAGNPNDSTFNQAVTCAKERQQQESRGFVPLFVECLKEIDPNASLGAIFANPELEISVTTPESEVVDRLNEEARLAVDRTFNIIRTRIDQFGVVSPNLQKQPGTGRILLELPGVKEPERVRKLLRSTAKLEFWTTHTWRDAYPVMEEINNKLRDIYGITMAEDSAAADTTDTALASEDQEAPEEGSLDAALAGEGDSSEEDDSLTGLSDVISDTTEDIDNLSEAELEQRREEFRRENPLFALLQFPNYEALQQQQSNSPITGYALAQDTAEINRILAMEDIQPLIPDDFKFAWGFKPTTEDGNYYELIALKTNAENLPALDGSVISNARQDFDQGQPMVSMSMNAEGSREWARITEANVGNHVAITLDGYVYSYPVVNQKISGGNSQISGGFEIEEAKDLANVLKAGQLPVPAQIEGEETVGPSLGVQNIRSGMYSFLVAFAITLIFMAFYYARAGLVANLALLANLFFILGCSAAFNIVLTLPGMAAIVLTVGMAVDANVLIFERIREEMKRGKTLKASIKSGFSNAFSSVMDANITTFLTGVILYAFGVGPIRGFAVALMIGILTSLISALIITRLILDYYGNKGKDSINFGTSFTTSLFDKIKIDMVGRKRTFGIVSALLVALSLGSIFTQGFKTGVDFKGGRQFVVAFKNTEDGSPARLAPNDVQQIRRDLTGAFGNEAPVVKTLSSDNQVMVTTAYLVEDRTATDQVTNMLMEGLNQDFGSDKPIEAEVISTSDVGPTVANDIREAAFLSVLFSLLVIFVYILIRFRKWQYSLGAIAALFHDVIITLGVFSVLGQFDDLFFNAEIDQNMIAALLTIVGYSINDTVVVFDRIRENFGEMKAKRIADIFNISIDQTISRTLITSLTTFITATILFIWGGDGIKGFIFAILIGIIVGTYSSIFVASPISMRLLQRGEKAEEVPA